MKSLLRILFPPRCLHCRQGHERLGTPLCKTCVSLLEVREAENLLVTFHSLSPVRSLITHLKRGGGSQIVKILAAYMAAQYAQSTFPLPDLITAVPTSRFRKWQMQQAPAEILADELGKILARPFSLLLKRKRQLLRQDLLDRKQRLALSSNDFAWKNKIPIKGKTVLIIDDTITTGTTLECCTEHLWQASPKKVIKMVCLDQGYLRE